MNIITDKLPSAVEIDGKAVDINTDFRTALCILRAFDDERLMETEKLSVLISLLYIDIPENTALAVAQGLKFLNLGKTTDLTAIRQEQVYNIEKDAPYIFTAFKSTFNIDLNSIKYLHWWEFRSLFADLGKDCFFNSLVSLRTRSHSGKLTKDEKKFVQRNRELISLTDTQKNKSAVEEFRAGIGRRT